MSRRRMQEDFGCGDKKGRVNYHYGLFLIFYPFYYLLDYSWMQYSSWMKRKNYSFIPLFIYSVASFSHTRNDNSTLEWF